MSERRSLSLLVAMIAFAGALVTGLAIWVVHVATENREMDSLRVQADLFAGLAADPGVVGPGIGPGILTPDFAVERAVIRMAAALQRNAKGQPPGWGLAIIRRSSAEGHFEMLMRYEDGKIDRPGVLETEDPLSPFDQRWNARTNGVVRSPDSHGHQALTAFSPVPGLDAYVLTWRHVEELRGAFLRMALPTVLAIAVMIILLGIVVNRRGRAVIEKLEDLVSQATGAEVLARAGHWEINPETARFEWSPALIQLLALDERSFDGSIESFISGVHPDDKERVRAALEAALLKGEGHGLTYRYLGADDTWRTIQQSAEAEEKRDGSRRRVRGWVQDVSQDEQARHRILAIRNELQVLVDNLPQRVVYTDLEGRILRVNQRAADDYGCTVRELVGQSALDLSGSQYTVNLSAIRTVVETGEAAFGELDPYKTDSGEDGWLMTDRVPVLAEDGTLSGVLTISTDVTERVKAEQVVALNKEMLEHEVAERTRQLENAQDRLLGAIEAIDGGFSLFDARDNLVLCNNQLKEMFPTMADCLVPGANYEDLMNEVAARGAIDVPDGDLAAWKTKAMASHQARESSGVFRTADGRWFHVNEKATPDGGVIGVRTDITHLKEAEKALAESMESYRSIVNTTSEGFWMIDEKGETVDCNDALCRMLGYSREELLGTHPSDHVTQERREAMESQIANRGHARQRRYETTIGTRDGRPLEVVFHSTTKLNEDGEVIGSFAFVTDVTDYVKIQRELEQARDEAHRANLAKSEFLSRMSHELRTPMNAILGFGQLLQVNLKGSEVAGQADYVDHILDSGHHLLGLIDDILDLARIEAGHLRVQAEPVVSDDLLAEVRMLVEQHREKVEGVFVEPWKERAENPLIKADSMRLKQVLVNLMTNALKYGGEKPEVTLDAKLIRGGQQIEYSVTDHGPGVPDHLQEVIFDAFHRLERDEGRAEGVGIGLTVCRQLCELMDGQIGLDSKPGEGARFWVRMPVWVDEKSGAEAPAGLDNPMSASA
ncbi:MAG: PAS domain-containing sensor histidine kinase [Magnetovibrionaceae bacterium]